MRGASSGGVGVNVGAGVGVAVDSGISATVLLANWLVRAHAATTMNAAAKVRNKRYRIEIYFSPKALSTSSACSSTFTLSKILAILPCSLMRNVLRFVPMYFLPYMLFSPQTP